MQLNTLEFPKILDRLATYAMFSASKTLVRQLQPTPYFTEAHSRMAETTEAVRLLSVKDTLSVGGARDVRPATEQAKRGFVLAAEILVEIQQTLISARELQRILSKLATDYPLLADITYRIEPCPGIINRINQVLDERGEVRDDASPKLQRIRREISTVHGRLQEKLQRLVSNPNNASYLQDTIITQRDGRYVIPLKASFKSKIQGVVHDQSSSGQTVFVEPLATVELNNQWRQLQLDEADEIRRILAELSALIGEQAEAISHTVAALAELDMAFAKAKYAVATKATEPLLLEMNETAQIKLVQARHPLLDPKTVVPVDIELPEQTRVLVITGPNTGGKTVSLKTVGLLALMAQSGLWLPTSEGSVFPVFNHILADIGDEQSIEQSLSTFSGHMTNIVRILQQCDEKSLAIFDELGSGTDPIEGSALARAILSQLLTRGVTTFIATHYSELKAYAHATRGVANASMEFDMEELAPTYRLLIGLPGASNAFTISQRLGLPQAIINEAQGLVGDETKQVEAMLAEIKNHTETTAHLHEEAAALKAELERRLADIQTERKDILSSAREDARREIKAARQQIRALQEEASQTITEVKQKTVEQVELTPEIAQIDEKLDQLDTAIEAKEKPKSAPPKPIPQSRRPLQAGDTVFIATFNTEGEVMAVQNKQVEVQMGHFRTTVPLSQVERRKKNQPEPSYRPAPTVSVPEMESPGMELDLRGQVAEEALHKMDNYLDKAYLARLPWVRIIHGKGSGVLRQAVRQALHNHALISSYRPGEGGEGGEGVTVANLAVS